MKCNAIILFWSIFFYVSTSAQVLIDFETVSLTNSYQTGFFYDSDSIVWQYTKARSSSTEQNKNRALCLNKAADASLISDTLPYGISHLSFIYQQAFSTNCNARVYINDSLIGILQTQQAVGITYSFIADSLLYPYPCVIKFVQANGSAGQIALDDILYIPAIKPEKPFTIEHISIHEDSIKIRFSRSVRSADIYLEHSSSFLPTIIQNNTVFAPIPKDICGTVRFTLSNILDSTLTQIPDTTFSETYIHTPSPHEIVFSELYVHTSSDFGPLSHEYIEIYNRSSCPQHIHTMSIIVGNTECFLPSFIIPPNEYAVLYHENHEWHGKSDVLHIPVARFPSLPNTQARIALLSAQRTIINSVHYQNTWYKNAFKRSGGWSLEKIDLNNLSETGKNWQASESIEGGTPGRENSVHAIHPDTTPLSIISFFPRNDTVCKLLVSKNMCSSQILTVHIDNNTITAVESYNYSLQEFLVHLSSPIPRGKKHHIHHKNIVDLQGVSHYWHYPFARYDTLFPSHPVVIHEILSNPHIGESEFIELYNAGEYYYNTNTIFLARIVQGEYSQIYPASIYPQVWEPQSYLVISKDAIFWKEQSACAEHAIFSEVELLPTLPQTSGNIVVLNQFGQVIDSVWYSPQLHNPSLRSTRGVSLERVSIAAQSNSPANWQSVSYLGNTVSPGCNGTSHKTVRIITKTNILSARSPNCVIEITAHTAIQGVQYRIYSMSGHEVYAKEYRPHTTHIQCTIPYEDLRAAGCKPGMYVLKIITHTNSTEEKEIFLYIE